MTDSLIVVLASSPDDGPATLRWRGLVIILLVVVMFAVAGLALLIGKRRQARRNARDLSALTGFDGAASQGGDDPTLSKGWYDAAKAEGEQSGPTQAWQDVLLGDGGDGLTGAGSPATAVSGPHYAAATEVKPAAPLPTMQVTPTAATTVAGTAVPAAASVATPAEPAVTAGNAGWSARPADDGEDAMSADWWEQAIAEDDSKA